MPIGIVDLYHSLGARKRCPYCTSFDYHDADVPAGWVARRAGVRLFQCDACQGTFPLRDRHGTGI